MAVLRKVRHWFGDLPTVLQIAFLMAVVLAGRALYIHYADHHTESPQYKANLTFCTQRASDEADATEGLHSIGGQWWQDRVDECMAEKD